jgi:decaprenylphospho-beta-D-erythro-pentofuranosid-2-ulose 2-reductase
MMEKVLILGATSGIARALGRVLAERQVELVLAGRRLSDLERDAADLGIRGGTRARAIAFEALDFDGHAAFYRRAQDLAGGPFDGVVLAYGYMTDQDVTEKDFAEARRTVDVNFTSALSILNVVANDMEERRSGWIAAISSVAGDRGRQSNYTYGASKAGLSAYLGGLRNRLHASGVHVLEVKPGFVDTPMTQGLLDPNSPLVASPETVARAIDRAIRARKNVVYTPWFWRGIMTTIRSIPESIFKRLKL